MLAPVLPNVSGVVDGLIQLDWMSVSSVVRHRVSARLMILTKLDVNTMRGNYKGLRSYIVDFK